ncbi:MAG: DUF1080 domain-containing protein [Planctomycetota bacterium]
MPVPNALLFAATIAFSIVVSVLPVDAQTETKTSSARSPFEGRWAFQLPDQNVGWLHLMQDDQGEWSGSLLWSVGNARPLKSIKAEDSRLLIQRPIRWKPGGGEVQKFINQPIVCELDGQQLTMMVAQSWKQIQKAELETYRLSAKRISEPPPKPDLKTLKFGEPIQLFSGDDLSGWKLSRENKKNGWRADNGELVNETPKKDFGAYGDFGNLITERNFQDFELSIEYNVSKGGNSGIYLRGMYEAQVVDRDSKMQGIQGPGAIFGRIKPSENAANPGGQWNRYVITLAQRHITVVLNGKKVIDNQLLEGPTGGGILSHDDQPGPIFLQGDHTSIRYRNIVLRPIEDESSTIGSDRDRQ